MQILDDFYRGDTQVYRLTIKKDDGSPYDLTGCKVMFTMKSDITLTDNDAAVKKDVTNHVDPTNGVTEVKLDPSDTSDLDIGSYYYDFQLVTSSGDVKTMITGKVKVLADVTRRT